MLQNYRQPGSASTTAYVSVLSWAQLISVSFFRKHRSSPKPGFTPCVTGSWSLPIATVVTRWRGIPELYAAVSSEQNFFYLALTFFFSPVLCSTQHLSHKRLWHPVSIFLCNSLTAEKNLVLLLSTARHFFSSRKRLDRSTASSLLV